MKFPQPGRSPVKVISAVHSVVEGAVQTFLRFPLAILLAVAGTMFGMHLVHLPYEGNDLHYWYKNSIATAYLGMMGSIALTVLGEKRALGRGMRIGLQGAVSILAVLYYLSLPDHYTQQAVIRFVLYALGLHWLIACIAFSGRENNGFWVFNKRLFLRILTSILYTVVLYVGLTLALLAIDQLFKVNIDSSRYLDIWLLLVGVFNTWFFLSGFPADYESPAVVADYPRGLKIFTQFVLLPILTIYLLILYAYLFRIIFTATWPYEWVTYLVLCFSVAGILAILLVWPLSADDNNKWISGYSRFFYFALFPLIVMLFIAIFQRLAAYGITELRYFVLLLAMWLLFVAIYFLVSKRKSIRLIPLSLCVLAFLVSFGPWGAAGVSLYSQRYRLKALLVKDKILVDGKITGVAEPVSLKDRKEISSITQYLVEVHGYRVLQHWFREDLDSMLKRKSHAAYFETEALLKAMKVRQAESWTTEDIELTEVNEEGFYVNLRPNENNIVAIKGYDYLIKQIRITVTDVTDADFQIDNYAFGCRLDSAGNKLTLSPGKDSVLTVDLTPVATAVGLEQSRNVYTLPVQAMTLDAGNSQWAARLILERFNGIMRDGKKHITSLNGYLLMKKN
jgi:hypothetical protein